MFDSLRNKKQGVSLLWGHGGLIYLNCQLKLFIDGGMSIGGSYREEWEITRIKLQRFLPQVIEWNAISLHDLAKPCKYYEGRLQN